jgi:hypothetical protein
LRALRSLDQELGDGRNNVRVEAQLRLLDADQWWWLGMKEDHEEAEIVKRAVGKPGCGYGAL